MLVESAIRNLQDAYESVPRDSIDWLDLTWLDCRTRFAKRSTRSGREVRLLLRLRESLKHGDLLGHWPDGTAVAVNLLPTDLLLIRLRNLSDAISAVFQIGNLHVPMEVAEDRLLVPAHAETEAALVTHNIPFENTVQRFQPTHWPPGVQLSSNFQVVQAR